MISVCMATYNGEKYLREQIDSILIQLSSQDELIVSDDGSTDTTLSILQSYNDDRIKIFKNDNGRGVITNFENALNQVKGDYIFLSDQDDVWLEGKVHVCLDALKSSDLVVTDCIVVDGELNVITPSFFRSRSSGAGFWKNLVKNSYVGACIAFKRELLGIILPIPSNLPVYHDGWIASLADITGKVIFVEYKGINFRRHEQNTSFSAKKSGLSLYEQFRYRVVLLWLIFNRIMRIK